MAKNLKLKIKNTQFAEALKRNKLAKPPAKKKPPEVKAAPEVKPVEEEQVAPVEEAPKKKRRVASDLPKSLRSTPEPAKEPEKPTEAPKVEEEEYFPKKRKPIPFKVSSNRVGYIRPGTDKKSLAEKRTQEAIEAKKRSEEEKKRKATAKTAPEKTSTTGGFTTPDKKKRSTSLRDLKENRLSGKRLLSQQKPSFDARDRQGLRGSDEGHWRRRRPHQKMKSKKQAEPIIRPDKLTVKLPITIKDLAAAMKYKAAELIGKLMMQGIVATINDYLDDETTVQLLGHEFGCELTIDTTEEKRLQITDKSITDEISEEDPSSLVSKAPVIAFMGHVDHGKTSLIDYVRKSKIAEGEAGAITQHIGAFRCPTSHGDLTILDTPGHEAFSAMRSRGATVTDVIVLVVAGDEGIKPQTDEAIQQAKEAGVPIVVAINKCDKPDFNADEIYRQLSDRELLPEAWGGEVPTANCSAISGEGVSELLELVGLQSEILELKANPEKRARGSILESELKKGLGITATLLVQNGTLKHGDALVIDHVYGRVKTMHDEQGKIVKTAGPSFPVEITGLSDVPEAGLEFIVVGSEKEAKKLSEDRLAEFKQKSLRKVATGSLEGLLEKQKATEAKKVLNVILKGDVQGSIEAVQQSLEKIKSDKASVNIIATSVGEISESDIERAAASNAIIFGFHTKIEPSAEEMIKRLKVRVKLHDIIYHLVDETKELMVALLDKLRQEDEVGEAEVRQVFKSSQLGLIAGCQVTSGTLKRNNYAKLFRNGECIWEGNFASLKRVQEDVKEVSKGLECGILLSGFKAFEAGDSIKAYEISYITDTL